MPPDNIPRFGSGRLAKYPHLIASDVPIWERFLDNHGHSFQGFDYDVHVGQGITPPVDTPENIRRMALHLTQKRIDAVGYKPGQIWLIEVKERPGVGAIGQILSYITLYRKQFKPSQEIVPVIVADLVEPDIRFILRTRKVKFYEV